MYPFLLEVSNSTGLYQLKDGRYQTIKDGEPDPMMIGHGYILVTTDMAEKLQAIGVENISFEPAVIWDRQYDIEYSNYQLMSVHRHFDHSHFPDVDLDGKCFLVMDNHHLFATPELKQTLETAGFGFEFSEGLSRFA